MVVTTAMVVAGAAELVTTVVRGLDLLVAPTPTPRQQQIQKGKVKIAMHIIRPTIEPITAPAMTPADVPILKETKCTLSAYYTIMQTSILKSIC